MKKKGLCLAILLLACCLQSCVTGVSREERAAVHSDLSQKRFEFYCDSILKVTSIGAKLLQPHAENTGAVLYGRLPFLTVGVNSTVQEGGYADLPKNSVMVIGPLRGFMPEKGDFRRGDRIIEINQQPIENQNDYFIKLQEITHERNVAVKFQHRDGSVWSAQVPIILQREPITFMVDANNGSVDAYTDTLGVIVVSSPMLRFVKNDNELAFVLAHEIGHIEAGHFTGILATNLAATAAAATAASALSRYAPAATAASTLVYALASAPFSQVREQEADRLSVKIMADAGYDPRAALAVMRRFAVEIPMTQKNYILQSHPSSPERYEALKTEVEKEAG